MTDRVASLAALLHELPLIGSDYDGYEVTRETQAAWLIARGVTVGGDIAALLAEVARLKREYALLMESHQGMANENLRLGGKMQALREALEPFARQWDASTPYHGLPSDKVPVQPRMTLTYGDLRRARAALQAVEETP